MRSARCLDCDQDYQTTDVKDDGLCPRCEAQETARYAAAYAEPEPSPRPFSKAAMLERLGVCGDTDD